MFDGLSPDRDMATAKLGVGARPTCEEPMTIGLGRAIQEAPETIEHQSR